MVKEHAKVIYLSCEFTVTRVDKARGKVWIRNNFSALKKDDMEVDAHRIRTDGY
jgi:hypothetical protein